MKKNKLYEIQIPIFLKLSFVFVILAIIPLAITAGNIYNSSLSTIRKEQQNSDTNLLQLMSKHVEYRLKQINEQQKDLYKNLELMKYFNDYPGELNAEKLANIEGELHDYLLTNAFSNSIHLLLNNGQIISSSWDYRIADVSYSRRSLMLFQKNEYDEILDMYPTGKCHWFPSFTLQESSLYPENIQQNFSIGRIFRNTANRLEPIGYLFQCIDVGLFDDCFSFLTDDPALCFLILDTDGSIIWSSNTTWTTAAVSDVIPAARENRLLDTQTYTIDNIRYYVTEKKSDYNNWTYYMLTPQASLENRITSLKTFSFVVVAVCILVFVLGTLSFYWLVTKPIKRLVVYMHSIKPSAQTPDIPAHLIPHSNDEIGLLYRSFFEMQQRISLLIKQKTNFHEQKLNQELLTLQAQINPHFLYNTLDAINWMAISHSADDICCMVQALSKILRYSIGKKYRSVTFSDELEIIKDYVYIQQYRFNNSFDVVYQVDSSVMNCRIDRLILQPFIENSINHGISKKSRQGQIELNIRHFDTYILITIHDNGVGITPQKISAIMSGQTDSIGIYNISQFLRLKYGPEYGVTITSIPNEETSVQIIYPYMESGDS